jgi:hypothetical protein
MEAFPGHAPAQLERLKSDGPQDIARYNPVPRINHARRS